MRGAWIEIARFASPRRAYPGRSPCGERGLKFSAETQPGGLILSLPVRGAWIEIVLFLGGEDLRASLPVRGAWIEIIRLEAAGLVEIVAPRAGSVD